jgi:phosphate-selective porin OprO/OprP
VQFFEIGFAIGGIMRFKHLAYAMSVAFTGVGANNAYALDLYMDSKTKQIYAEPGPGRIRLGNFERVDEEATEEPKAPKKAADSKGDGDQIRDVEARLNKKIDALANKPKAPDDAEVTLGAKGLQFQSNDGNFKFAINGRLHADAAIQSGDKFVTYNDNDPSNGRFDPADEDATKRDLDSGTELRRVRIEVAGQFFNDWRFKLQPDYADEQVRLKDAFVKYTGFAWGDWTIGQSKQPYSFQQMMSSNDMPFMARSLEYAFTDVSVNRAIGLRFDMHGQNWTAATGIYGDTATRQADSAADDEGWGVSGRATWAPWFKPGELLHVGASAAYRVPQQGDKTVRYRNRPTHIDHFYPIDTGNIGNIDDEVFFNAEATGAYGPLSFESEYNVAYLQRNGDGIKDAKFDGWHFDVMYSLTGESRAAAYDPKDAVIKRLTPNRNFDLAGGRGAWELKGRISQVNMNKTGTPDQHGGRETAATLGVNWYLNPWFRLMLDYTHVIDIDLGTAGTSRALLEGDPSDLDTVQMRGSLAF